MYTYSMLGYLFDCEIDEKLLVDYNDIEHWTIK